MAKAPARPAAKAAETKAPAAEASAKTTRRAAPAAAAILEPPPAPEPETAAEPVNEALTAFDLYVDAAKGIDGKFEMPGAKETEQAFYKRLMQTLSTEQEVGGKLPIWDSLEKTEIGDVQPWYNNGVDALEKSQPVAALEGYDSYKQKVAATPTPEKAARGAGLAAHREKVAAEKAAGTYVAPEKKAKEPAAPKEPRAPGVVSIAREYIVKNHTKMLADVTAHFKGANPEYKESTIAAVYTDTQATIKLAIAAGLFKA
jgi:hypothetical protein